MQGLKGCRFVILGRVKEGKEEGENEVRRRVKKGWERAQLLGIFFSNLLRAQEQAQFSLIFPECQN